MDLGGYMVDDPPPSENPVIEHKASSNDLPPSENPAMEYKASVQVYSALSAQISEENTSPDDVDQLHAASHAYGYGAMYRSQEEGDPETMDYQPVKPSKDKKLSGKPAPAVQIDPEEQRRVLMKKLVKDIMKCEVEEAEATGTTYLRAFQKFIDQVNGVHQENRISKKAFIGRVEDLVLSMLEESEATDFHIMKAYTDALKLPEITSDEKLRKYDELTAVFTEFVSIAQTYGEVIVSEIDAPAQHKTLRSVSVGGIAGGSKFIVR
jgi:hypothetical protein